MRNWIDIITEGEIINLQQHKLNKAVDVYSKSINSVVNSEANFFATGKFIPFAEYYIESGFKKGAEPWFELTVNFRDFKLEPKAKELLRGLRLARFKINQQKYHKDFSGTKEGPWATKRITFDDVREIFRNRADSPFGAYQPSKSGFRSTYVENWSDCGVGFNIVCGGMDDRRYGTVVFEYHIIDNDKDMKEVSDMMTVINHARLNEDYRPVSDSGESGCWITSDGEILSCDYDEDVHHGDIAMGYFDGNEDINDNAINNGWVRIRSNPYDFFIQCHPSKVSMKALNMIPKAQDGDGHINYILDTENGHHEFNSMGKLMAALRGSEKT